MCIPRCLPPFRFIRAEAVLRVVEQELPESAALLRLSGMEVTECLSEVCHWLYGGLALRVGWGLVFFLLILSGMEPAYLHLLIKPLHTCCRGPRWDRTFPVV